MDYTITDDNTSTNVNYADLLRSVNETVNNNSGENYNSNYQAQLVNYSLNYTMKDLKRIAKYYKINIRKKVKDELIYSILLFENNADNYNIVSKRKELWYYLEQLLDDPFFHKYIYFD